MSVSGALFPLPRFMEIRSGVAGDGEWSRTWRSGFSWTSWELPLPAELWKIVSALCSTAAGTKSGSEGSLPRATVDLTIVKTTASKMVRNRPGQSWAA